MENKNREARVQFIGTLTRKELLRMTRRIGLTAHKCSDEKLRQLIVAHGDRLNGNKD